MEISGIWIISVYVWGGPWTNQKLDAFEKYVNAYLTIMNVYRHKDNWKLIYFDGFAGSGSRQEVVEDDSMWQTLFEKDIYQEDTKVYRGSAERVLSISQTGFDHYYFIDIDAKANKELEKRLNGLKNYNKCAFRNGDANDQVQRLCQAMKDNPKLRANNLTDVSSNASLYLQNTGTLDNQGLSVENQSKISSVPTQQKNVVVSIEREQKTKEEMYLY
jgi:16S rRNA G966 N2-methylase RsmD